MSVSGEHPFQTLMQGEQKKVFIELDQTALGPVIRALVINASSFAAQAQTIASRSSPGWPKPYSMPSIYLSPVIHDIASGLHPSGTLVVTRARTQRRRERQAHSQEGFLKQSLPVDRSFRQVWMVSASSCR
jgi:hypothetical protein